MGYYDCHGVTEICEGLFLSGVLDVEEMVARGVEVLVPLAFLDGDIWRTGFRGEILYCPVLDLGTLPEDVLWRLTGDICARLDQGKKVGLFCAGGHGRTGYVAACVLARRGVENPIAYLHEHYCRWAVESEEQLEGILRFIVRLRREGSSEL